MTTYADLVRQWKERDMRVLRILLDLHVACLNGVTASEAAEWLEMPPGKASVTTVGIMLKELGYRRYRRDVAVPDEAPRKRDYRLFPSTGAPDGWTK